MSFEQQDEAYSQAQLCAEVPQTLLGDLVGRPFRWATGPGALGILNKGALHVTSSVPRKPLWT